METYSQISSPQNFKTSQNQMITIKAKFGSSRNIFRNLEKKQMPFAASVAINKTAAKIIEEEEKEVQDKVDRPAPQTKKPYYMIRSNKRRLMAVVRLKERNRYLTGLIRGGTEKENQPVPGKDVRLNKYGNLTKKATKGKGVFAADIKGLHGYWKKVGRKRRGIQLVAHFPDRRTYSKRIDFHGTADRAVKRHFRRELSRAVQYARRTAR